MPQQSLPGRAQHESSTVRPFLESVFRHRGLWLAVAVFVIGLTVAFALLMPRQYRSEMSILVQNARGTYQVTPQRTTGSIEVNGVTEEQINSEIEVLRSRGLANVVVDPQWNDNSFRNYSPAQLKAHDKAVEDFNKHLSIELARKSNVIHIAFTASDPNTANQTLRRLLNAFLAKQKDLGHPPGTYSSSHRKQAATRKNSTKRNNSLRLISRSTRSSLSLTPSSRSIARLRTRKINSGARMLRSGKYRSVCRHKQASLAKSRHARIHRSASSQMTTLSRD